MATPTTLMPRPLSSTSTSASSPLSPIPSCFPLPFASPSSSRKKEEDEKEQRKRKTSPRRLRRLLLLFCFFYLRSLGFVVVFFSFQCQRFFHCCLSLSLFCSLTSFRTLPCSSSLSPAADPSEPDAAPSVDVEASELFPSFFFEPPHHADVDVVVVNVGVVNVDKDGLLARGSAGRLLAWMLPEAAAATTAAPRSDTAAGRRERMMPFVS